MSTELQSMADESQPNYEYNADDGGRRWQERWRDMVHYRYLLRNLVARDLKARYKNSVLGILWSLLNPLFLMIVFTILFSVMGNNQIRQYPIFVLVGLIPWNFFNGSLLSGTTSRPGTLPGEEGYFPREMLPISALLSNLVNF
ncbi:MAG: ABC transporter permease [Chloroflexota bacterium]